MTPGLLDIANPILLPLDDALAKFLPPIGRVIVVAVLLTWAGMWLYRVTSAQKHLRALKRLARLRERGLHDPDIAFDELLRRARRSIALQFAVLGRVFVPSLVGMLPLLFGMSAISTRLSYRLPTDESMRGWCVSPETDYARVALDGVVMGAPCVDKPWAPGLGATVAVDGNEIVHGLGKGASNILHRPLWWNTLIGNPAGYLPESAGDLEIVVQHPSQELIGVGPDWFRHWLFWFLVPSIVLGFWWRWRWKLV